MSPSVRLESLTYESVGPDGLEPSPAWVRARYAAANTLIPCFVACLCQSARKESNLRPGPYKSPALATELRAVSGWNARSIPRHVRLESLTYETLCAVPVGPEGFEPSPCRLKGGCAAVTPRPQIVVGPYAFESLTSLHRFAPCWWKRFFAIVRGGVEPTAGDVSHRHASVTTPDCFKSGWRESNPHARAPKARGPPLPYIPWLFSIAPISAARRGIEPRSPA